jgi:predicted DNA-binding WGR domain protein
MATTCWSRARFLKVIRRRLLSPYKDTLTPCIDPPDKNKEHVILHKPSDGAAGAKGSFKQWSARIPTNNPTAVVVSWGREGAQQQTVTHTFGTVGGANDQFLAMVREKRKKGYTYVR